jgi:HPt (histidine-containing phosphotransfer) domain-containing protein
MLDSTLMPFNIESLLERFRGKSALVEQVLGEFAEQAIRDLDAAMRSIKANDSPATASVAHGLKGAAGLLCAKTLHRLAAELEQKGLRGELDGAGSCLAEVRKEVERCLAYISEVRLQMSRLTESSRQLGGQHAHPHR